MNLTTKEYDAIICQLKMRMGQGHCKGCSISNRYIITECEHILSVAQKKFQAARDLQYQREQN